MKPTTLSTLPGRVDSAMLAKFLHDGEPVILLKLIGVGNSAPYDFRDKGTRSYIFRFDANLEGHTLRIPLHLWQENKARLAHDIMDQRHMVHAMVVTLEPSPAVSKVPVIPQTTISEKMGATDTRTDARNVVGPGAEPTVAPASGSAGGALTVAEPLLTMVDGLSFVARRAKEDGLPEAESTAESVAAVTVQAAEPVIIDGKPLHQAAYDLLESPKRHKALAALLGVAETALRAALDHPQSQIQLATAGWVRRKV